MSFFKGFGEELLKLAQSPVGQAYEEMYPKRGRPFKKLEGLIGEMDHPLPSKGTGTRVPPASKKTTFVNPQAGSKKPGTAAGQEAMRKAYK